MYDSDVSSSASGTVSHDDSAGTPQHQLHTFGSTPQTFCFAIIGISAALPASSHISNYVIEKRLRKGATNI
ncbi:hypothetical protein OPQ81_010116 [Rhizoctonia solani]|nr:hypothetical protein OPQ81_010116 [Rhizoctonia solani]